MVAVNVGQAKTELSRLIAQAEAGDEVEIARDGVPVVRLTPVQHTAPGAQFLAARGTLAGQIRLAEEFELSVDELDAMGA